MKIFWELLDFVGYSIGCLLSWIADWCRGNLRDFLTYACFFFMGMGVSEIEFRENWSAHAFDIFGWSIPLACFSFLGALGVAFLASCLPEKVYCPFVDGSMPYLIMKIREDGDGSAKQIKT